MDFNWSIWTGWTGGNMELCKDLTCRLFSNRGRQRTSDEHRNMSLIFHGGHTKINWLDDNGIYRSFVNIDNKE